MSVLVRDRGGMQLNYSLDAHPPHAGFRVAFTGDRGSIDRTEGDKGAGPKSTSSGYPLSMGDKRPDEGIGNEPDRRRDPPHPLPGDRRDSRRPAQGKGHRRGMQAGGLGHVALGQPPRSHFGVRPGHPCLQQGFRRRFG